MGDRNLLGAFYRRLGFGQQRLTAEPDARTFFTKILPLFKIIVFGIWKIKPLPFFSFVEKLCSKSVRNCEAVAGSGAMWPARVPRRREREFSCTWVFLSPRWEVLRCKPDIEEAWQTDYCSGRCSWFGFNCEALLTRGEAVRCTSGIWSRSHCRRFTVRTSQCQAHRCRCQTKCRSDHQQCRKPLYLGPSSCSSAG